MLKAGWSNSGVWAALPYCLAQSELIISFAQSWLVRAQSDPESSDSLDLRCSLG